MSTTPSTDIDLTVEEKLTAVVEATKISIAAQVARILTDIVDEDENDLTDEQIQEELNGHFHRVVEEFDATLQQVLGRMIQAKANAVQGGLTLP